MKHKVVVEDRMYNPTLLRANRNTLFVFGDNTVGHGTGGQANVRYEPNAIGIPTKRLPSSTPEAYFNDKDIDNPLMIDFLELCIGYVIKEAKNYKALAFPAGGLGTGLSAMPSRCPRLFEWLNNRLEEEFGVKNTETGLYLLT